MGGASRQTGNGMQNIQRGVAVFVLMLMGCAFNPGCGGAANKDMESPQAKASTLSDDFANLDQNEMIISQALGYPLPAPPPPSGESAGGADPAIASGAPAATPTRPADSGAPGEIKAQRLGEGSDEGGSRNVCEIACRALSSMQRSADHVCELSSEEDERCSRAKSRVSQASERVRAHCTAC